LPSSLTEGLPSTSVCSTSPPVSVCGTGGSVLARGFSRPYGLDPCGLDRTSAPSRHPSVNGPTDLPIGPPYRLGGFAPPDLPPGVPPSLVTAAAGTGLVTRCPSPTPPGLGLGPPHPQVISMAAEPSGIRWERFALSSRYSCRHSHSPTLQIRVRSSVTAVGDAPLPRARSRAHPRRRRRA
jgi:hypothetical protein